MNLYSLIYSCGVRYIRAKRRPELTIKKYLRVQLSCDKVSQSPHQNLYGRFNGSQILHGIIKGKHIGADE